MKTICYFYNGHLCSTYKIKDEEEHLSLGNKLLLQGLNNNKTIKEMIKVMSFYVKLFHHRRINKLKVSSHDHNMFFQSLLGLIKLKVLDNDEMNGWFCGTYKKPKRHPCAI